MSKSMFIGDPAHKAFNQKLRRKKVSALTKVQTKEVKNIIRRDKQKNNEPKYLDTSAVNFSITTVGMANLAPAHCLTLVPQGAAQSQRVADSLTPIGMEFRYNCYFYNNLATTNGTAVRVILFRWNIDSAGGIPGAASIIQGTSQYLVVNSPYAWVAHHQEDFVIVYDRVHRISYSDQTSITRVKLGRKHMPKIAFNPGATTGENHLFVMMVSDDTGIVSGYPVGSYYARFLYADD